MRAVYKNENDREKIGYIFNEYRRLMLSKAYKILKDKELAEKALYEAFIQIWKNIDKIDDPRGSRAIVLAVTMAKNCAYALMDNKAKEFSPEKQKKGFSVKGMEEALYEMPASDILKLVNRLGGENRNIFIFKYAYDISIRNTARALNETAQNIEARLQIAQKRLRSLLLRGGY